MLSRLIDGGLRLLDQERLVKASEFWDAEWYAERYLEPGRVDKALSHFLRTGARKGYDPGPDFSSSAYLTENPDVAEAGTPPLLHYLRFGRFEGRIARDSHGRPSGTRDHGLSGEALAQVKHQFDPEFYRSTNPDLSPDIDPFDHFMGAGWRQRRDPVGWFSVERYLAAHSDVAGEGLNPFAHYILTGCREGRTIMDSVRSLAEAGKDSATSRLAAIAMVKNEGDIIRMFARHILALFDDIVIVDHQSSDGTRAYLDALAAANPRVEVLTLEEPSYIQSVTMTHVLRDRPQLRDAKWVFFLDADEFFPFEDRDALEAALEPFHACPVISMPWLNLVPSVYWQDEVTFNSDSAFLVPPAPSPFRKVALQPGRMGLERLVVAQGNHAVLERLNGVEMTAFEADFELLHVPVRSVDQIVLKLTQGVLAYQKIGARRDAGQGTHWVQMKEATEGAALSSQHLNALAERYSEEKPCLVPVTTSEMLAGGYEQRTFPIALTDDGLDGGLGRRNLSEVLMGLYATNFDGAADEDSPGAARLVTRGNRLVRADAEAEYGTLPKGKKQKAPREVTRLISDVLRPSYGGIVDLVPSDWAGHIPFMFALADLARPRRYVELGTLRGASFFAFAQAAQRLELECDAVAVSSWAVEAAKAGEFGNVFEDFQYIARKYSGTAAYLRMSYDDALNRFGVGSIDLLHLDGLHGFEEAERRLEAWLPKLSKRGLVLIHDIGVVGHGFGVWRLWDRLKEQYPTLEFGHSQGLGLACVGPDAPRDVVDLAEACRSDRNIAELLQEHFEQVASLSTELFSRRFDMAQMEMRAGAEGALAEEVSWLRQELASAQSELEDMRKMLKGEVRRAAG